MSVPRSYFGIEVVDDQIFVVGGRDSSTTMLAVERYDEDAGMWFQASSIEVPRRGLSCCVLHGLHGVAENLFPRGPMTPPNVEEAAGGSIWLSAQSRHMSSIVAWRLTLSFLNNKKKTFYLHSKEDVLLLFNNINAYLYYYGYYYYLYLLAIIYIMDTYTII